MALPDGLLTAARNYLNITWTDTDTDTKLTGILERGISYIDRVAGKAEDYTAEGMPRMLLLDYARYALADALEDFNENYGHELRALQIDERTAAYVASQTTTTP